jgi:KRAB domain-containing zinc finger protein
MQNNEQLFMNSFQNDSSNNSKEAETRSNPSPLGSKRKKPMPPLIPIKMAAGASSSSQVNKSDSDGNHESSGAEENVAENDMQQYKIISSLLQKRELSVESVYKNAAGNNENIMKKTGSFFDDIRKKLIEQNLTGNSDKNLVCKCGFEAKTLSDIIIHQKMCTDDKVSMMLASGSTRCQFCRIRFKTIVELASHIQKCPEAQNLVECNDSSSEQNGKDMEDYMSDEAAIDNPNERHSLDNRVFIWNKPKTEPSDTTNEGISDRNDDSDDNNLVVNEDDDLPETPTLTDSEYLGVESAPGYGEITKKIEPSDEVSNTAMKKVFKCPHCSFWASTASRFHVHIVGHLNKKPFECSLCAYRSNWRWDITKHIRLKLLRDPQHAEAKVLMNDETGRRNYSKYNKYITLMRVVDKKHDGRLNKSGLAGLNYSPKSSLVQENNLQSPPSSSSTPLSVYSEPTMNLATSGTSPIDPSVLLQHLSKDVNFLKNLQNFNLVAQNMLQQQQQQQQQAQQQSNEAQDDADRTKETENAKKTHFKCKKCYFK